MLNQQKNIAFAFLEKAEKNPDLLALVTKEVILNYAQLAQLVKSFALRMQDFGVDQGSIVSVDTDDILIAFPSLLASSLLGTQWIAHKNYAVLSDAVTPTHWFQSEDAPSGRKEEFVQIDESWAKRQTHEADTAGYFKGQRAKDEPWLYVNTSGTTGTPKLLAITQEMLWDRSNAVSDDFVERKTVFCSLFPCTAFPYITRAVACFVHGCTIVHGIDFDLWKDSGVNLLYGSMTQVHDALADVVLPQQMPVIHVSGSKLSDALAVHLLKSFDQVIDLYASTETNRSYKNVKRLDESGNLITVGQPLDSEVEIVDSNGNLCEPGESGVVRIKNRYLATGYLNNREAQEKSFKDGWFYSGDFGYWGDNRQLVIKGRVGDAINIGGIKINAAEIDEVLKSVDGLADAMCFDNPVESGISELLAFVTFEKEADKNECLKQAEEICRLQLSEVKTPKRLIEIDEIPRAHDGGAKRWMCHQVYREMEDRN